MQASNAHWRASQPKVRRKIFKFIFTLRSKELEVFPLRKFLKI